MKLEVLISCMHEKDHSIIERSNIQTDVVVVNQCDKNEIERFVFKNKKGEDCYAVFIDTVERGLSRSRNMALQNATADLCLICDDDEILFDDYKNIILKAFETTPHADLIAFNIKRPNKKPYNKIRKLSYLKTFMVSSVHITFKRERVKMKNIKFDIMLGSGSGHGGGEDTRFMRDCRENGLAIWSNPCFIGLLKNTGKSIWFKGFNKQFFIDSGWTTRRVFGDGLSIVKLIHYAIKHWPDYRKDISFFSAIKYSFVGWSLKR